jgi:16S rRNA (guanine527-N7)-methyltransferase
VTSRREQYDFATSRAVARLNILLELTAPYVKVGGKVLAMKGSAGEEELQEAASAISKLGLKLEKVAQFPVEDGNHCVIVLKKVKPTPTQYPRRYAKIKQSPL